MAARVCPSPALSSLFAGALTIALAGTFTVAPTVVAPTGYDGAAYADNGKGGGKGGGGGGGRGGERSSARGGDKADKGGRGGGSSRSTKGGGNPFGDVGKAFAKTDLGKALNRGQSKKSAGGERRGGNPFSDIGDAIANTELGEKLNLGQSKKAERQVSRGYGKKSESVTGDLASLHPSQKGRYNAKPAQAAIDAHIRNQNFNGTVGLMSQYELALKAQSGDPLNEYDVAALESFGINLGDTMTDAQIAEALNKDYGVADATFSYDGTTLTCEGDGCPDNLSAYDAEAAEMKSKSDANALANDTALGDFLDVSEQRLIDNANKPLGDISAPEVESEAIAEGETVEEAPESGFNDLQERLLDDIASTLGYERPEPVDTSSEVEQDLGEVQDGGTEPEGTNQALVEG
jgi:hypothetical protein